MRILQQDGMGRSWGTPQYLGVPLASPDLLPLPWPQLQAQKLRLAHSRGPYYSGSLPNVNQIGSGVSDFQVSSTQPLPWGYRGGLGAVTLRAVSGGIKHCVRSGRGEEALAWVAAGTGAQERLLSEPTAWPRSWGGCSGPGLG